MFRCNRITAALVLTLVALSALPVFAAEGKVNINTADADQLSLLPRVGSVVAERIVEFRDGNGRFKAIEDLMLVRGVGEKTFELMKPYLSLEGETTLNEKVRTPRAQSEDEG